MKGYQEIIWDNLGALLLFFCVLLFSSLPYLAFFVRILAVLCCSLMFSQSGWTSLVLPFSSAPQPFPLCVFPACHSRRSALAGEWHLVNSPGEILGSLKLVAKFPLTSAWPGFHPLALKCSVLLRASTSVSSAFLQALWLHQQLEQKELCHGATGLGRSFLAVRCYVSFASEGVLWRIYPRAWVILALRLSKVCVPFYIFSLLIWLLIALSQIT